MFIDIQWYDVGSSPTITREARINALIGTFTFPFATTVVNCDVFIISSFLVTIKPFCEMSKQVSKFSNTKTSQTGTSTVLSMASLSVIMIIVIWTIVIPVMI